MNSSAGIGHAGRHAVSFVLIEPSHPGNVGAAARALQVMGFERLILVNPRFEQMHTHPEAIAFASGAARVLGACRITDSLDQAVQGARMTVAISAAGREFAPVPRAPEVVACEAAQMIMQARQQATLAQQSEPLVALVFGTERVGLSIAQAQQCSHLCTIDADPSYSSLNLAQALQIIAYEMRKALQAKTGGQAAANSKSVHPDDWPAPHEQIEGMLSHLEQTLVKIAYLDPARPKRLMPRLRALFARAALTSKEVDIWRGICQKVDHLARQSKERS